MLIAGTHSGCGKTTMTLALMQYLYRHGQCLVPFKAGPDFLDTMWHGAVCGHESWNLDTRMMGKTLCQTTFARHCAGADGCLIEGVMGMYDGVSGVSGEGSSAHLAQTLDVAVALVVSVRGMSGSLVPLLEGFVFRAKAMGVRIAGVLLNHVGSSNHLRLLQGLLAEHRLPPVLAWMQKHAPTLPSRHLGLQRPEEVKLPEFGDYLHVLDHEALLQLTRPTCTNHTAPLIVRESQPLYGRQIAIARDQACCFIYPANVQWLREQGAELVFFSPLRGEPVPERTAAVWLPGGYPELYADELAMSPTLTSLRQYAAADGIILAECGGMMLLGTAIDHVPMAGVLPCAFEMQPTLVALGYRQTSDGLRGHEFHHSHRVESVIGGQQHAGMTAFDVPRGDRGIRLANVRASYIHWYFPSQPEAALRCFGASLCHKDHHETS